VESGPKKWHNCVEEELCGEPTFSYIYTYIYTHTYIYKKRMGKREGYLKRVI
jgi:hypothetical protein